MLAWMQLASSGQVSRAVLDSFFDCGGADPNPAGEALAALVTSLVPCAGVLAEHFVGQHVLRKAFEAADIAGVRACVRVCVCKRERRHWIAVALSH